MIISISGLSGAGKSTFAQGLSEFLRWPNISFGKYFRETAKRKGYSIYELSSMPSLVSEIDKVITQKVSKKLQKLENCVLDAHGAAFLAKDYQQIAILLYCALDLRTERVAIRTNENYAELKRQITALDKKTIQRFKEIYGKNIMEFDYYDIILNTERMEIRHIIPAISAMINSLEKHNGQ